MARFKANANSATLRMRAWRSKNRERDDANKRAWRAKNRQRVKEKAKSYYTANRDQILKRCKEYGISNKEQIAIRYKARTYGITPKRVMELLLEQDRKCAICKNQLSAFGRNMALDHDHKTNKVRKFLCIKCNSGIAMFGDDVEIMKAAISYLDSMRG